MIQVIGPSPAALQAAKVGEQIGGGLAQALGQYQQQKQQRQQQSQLANLLFGDQGQQYQNLPIEAQLRAAQLQAMQQQAQQKETQKSKELQEKEQKERQEAEILSKYQTGENISPEEMKRLSPTSLRTLIGQQKPTFEPTEERLEAERVSKLATELEGDYQAAKSEDFRLSRMEELSNKGDLSTPMMKKTLDMFGLPLGVLNNPDSEEFAKLEADYLRDVRTLFPGRVTNYEVQSFMKGIPTLSNTKEGRDAILRNRRIMNEAKKLKYEAYKDILKENRGTKPRNLGLLLEERTSKEMDRLAKEFRSGMDKALEPHLPTYNVQGPDGKIYKIPANKLKNAIDSGGKLL